MNEEANKKENLAKEEELKVREERNDDLGFFIQPKEGATIEETMDRILRKRDELLAQSKKLKK